VFIYKSNKFITKKKVLKSTGGGVCTTSSTPSSTVFVTNRAAQQTAAIGTLAGSITSCWNPSTATAVTASSGKTIAACYVK